MRPGHFVLVCLLTCILLGLHIILFWFTPAVWQLLLDEYVMLCSVVWVSVLFVFFIFKWLVVKMSVEVLAWLSVWRVYLVHLMPLPPHQLCFVIVWLMVCLTGASLPRLFWKRGCFKQVSLLYKVFMPVLHVVTSQVSHTATDGGATTSAIHCWTPSIRCARPHGLKLLAGRPPRTAGLWVL